MKKIYLSTIASLILAGSFSQNRLESNFKPLPIAVPSQHAPKNINTNRATTIDDWLDFETYYSFTHGNVTPVNWILGTSFALTTDSTHLYKVDTNDTGGFEITNPGIYSVGKVFPLSGEIYQTTLFNPGLKPYDPATMVEIDSIQIFASYNQIDPLVTDTVVVTLTAATTGAYTFPGFLYDVNSNMAIDTVYYPRTTFNSATKQYSVATSIVKIPLTNANIDTTGNNAFSHVINFDATGVNFVTGNFLTASYTFKPGKVITNADTVGINANGFIPGFRGFNTTSQYPEYDVTNADINDLWTNHLLLKDGFYGIGSNPGVSPVPWGYDRTGNSLGNFDNLLIDLKVKQTNTFTASISELVNGAKLYQNFPNPTSGLTNIRYSLEEAAQVSFDVVDVTGKTVYSSLEGNKSEGNHTIELNNNNLKAGVYFYSINVNGNRLTKKMTITK